MHELSIEEDILQTIKAMIKNLREENNKKRIEIDKNMEFTNNLENLQFSIVKRIEEKNKSK